MPPARRNPGPASRAERRLRKKANAGAPRDHEGLLARIEAAGAAARAGNSDSRAAQALRAETAVSRQRGQDFAALAGTLQGGAAAFRAGAIDHSARAQRTDGPLAGAACRAGCAFCCVLRGEDGGLVTRHEAAGLHEALAAFAGLPDGRAWHHSACPALDPATRTCRAYDARPIICRSYFSADANACRDHAEGRQGAGPGAAVLVSYPLYLAVIALVRALFGAAGAPTFSLARVAAGAVEGRSLEDSLKAARQAPSVLKGERQRADWEA